MRIVILGLDTFARKNIAQIRALEAHGISYVVASNDQRGDSEAIFNAQGFRRSRLVKVSGGIVAKARTVWRLLKEVQPDLVELYAAGRMTPVYLEMVRMLGLKLLVVERGDIGCLGDYGKLMRGAIKLAYRRADTILYKETYMREPLARLSGAPLSFVPNCIEHRVDTSELADFDERKIDFIWANRIIRQRRAAWVVNAFADPAFAERRLTLLGVEERSSLPGHIEAEQKRTLATAGANVDIRGFVDPAPFFRQARFFCLPAEVVFGNNALLEAMSYGVVPIVTEAPGVELIVEDGVNGFVSQLSEDRYRDALCRAASLGEGGWRRMSRAAIETVGERYSLASWTDNMLRLYRGLCFDTKR